MQLELLQNGQPLLITTEEWRPVTGFLRYEVSNMGRFRNRFTGKHLSGTLSNNGYVHIGLFRDGTQVTKLAHRLVAETWLEKPSPKHTDVNHLNKHRQDNRISNLEWSTRSKNSWHAKQQFPIANSTDQRLTSDQLHTLRKEPQRLTALGNPSDTTSLATRFNQRDMTPRRSNANTPGLAPHKLNS